MIIDICTLVAKFPDSPERESLAIRMMVPRDDTTFSPLVGVPVDLKPLLERELIKAMEAHLQATNYEPWEPDITWEEEDIPEGDDNGTANFEEPTNH